MAKFTKDQALVLDAMTRKIHARKPPQDQPVSSVGTRQEAAPAGKASEDN
jgi:hypothetical protein